MRSTLWSRTSPLLRRIELNPELAKVFDHPTRAAIVGALADGAATPKGLADTLDQQLSSVAYHVTVLHRHRCLAVVKTERRRGGLEREYELVPPASTGYIPRQEVPPPLRDYASGAVLQRIMDSGVTALADGALDSRDDGHLACLSFALDELAWADVDELMRETRTRLAAIVARAAPRLAKAGEPGVPATVVLAHFESRKRRDADAPDES